MEKGNSLMSYILNAASVKVRIPGGMVWDLLLAGALRDWVSMSLLYFSSYLGTGKVVQKLRSHTATPHRTGLVIFMGHFTSTNTIVYSPSVLSILVSKHFFFPSQRGLFNSWPQLFLHTALLKWVLVLAYQFLPPFQLLLVKSWLWVSLGPPSCDFHSFISDLRFSFLFWNIEICFLV